MSIALKLMEWVWPGDTFVRAQIRRLNRARLRTLREGGLAAQYHRKQSLISQIRLSPRAVCTELANEQHYEVPADFYQRVLGPHLKYSGGLWPEGVRTLAESETAMLELYVERAQLVDGQTVLDLGCGWGSLSLFLAARFPASRILGVSNSSSQREFILAEGARRGLSNLEIRTCDINVLELPAKHFDRIVSIEMLEHVRNYQQVFGLLRDALKPDGQLFVHVFAHKDFAYTFDPRGGEDWMEREFFSGGMMPSLDLFLHFTDGLRLENQWVVPGWHYEKTANAWLEQLRLHKSALTGLLQSTYGKRWRKYWLGWQLFFLACAELFGEAKGEEWIVHHMRWSVKGEG